MTQVIQQRVVLLIAGSRRIRDKAIVTQSLRIKRRSRWYLVTRLLRYLKTTIQSEQIFMIGVGIADLRLSTGNRESAKQKRLGIVIGFIWQKPGVIALSRGRRGEVVQRDRNDIVEALRTGRIKLSTAGERNLSYARDGRRDKRTGAGRQPWLCGKQSWQEHSTCDDQKGSHRRDETHAPPHCWSFLRGLRSVYWQRSDWLRRPGRRQRLLLASSLLIDLLLGLNSSPARICQWMRSQANR